MKQTCCKIFSEVKLCLSNCIPFVGGFHIFINLKKIINYGQLWLLQYKVPSQESKPTPIKQSSQATELETRLLLSSGLE